MLDRRTFLRRLGFGTVAAAAAATGVLDIERLLWVPGEKTIFVPEAAAIEGFATIDWLTAESLRMLTHNMRVELMFNRELGDMLADRPAKVRIPKRWVKMSVAS